MNDLRRLALALGLGLTALLASAGLVIALYLLLAPDLAHHRAQASGANIAAFRINGAGLTAQIGQGQASASGGLQVTALDSAQGGRALFTRSTQLKAADLPFLQLSIDGLQPETKAYFIWRQAGKPQQLHHIPLTATHAGRASYQLALHPDWSGSIGDIGIDIYAQPGQAYPRIDEVRLQPASATQLLASVWSQWRQYSPWTYASINHLRAPVASAIPPPTLVAGITALLALLMLGLARLLPLSWPLKESMLVAALLPWIGLDLIWQQRLADRVDVTQARFEGKSREQQQLAEIDGDLYQLAQRLKQEHLGAPGARIFLLNEKVRGHHFRRLRAQYHLLPHNIYNFTALPDPDQLQAGDYLLVVDPLPELAFDQARSELRWNQLESLPVQRVYADAVGQLYRVTAGASI